jgi:putative peptidoglycan lipid II flippase
MLVTSGGTLISRVTGLVREILIAGFFGAGSAALAGFIVAFTVPNLFRRLFGEGALSDAALPVINEEMETKGRSEAFALATTLMSVVAVVLCGLVGIGVGVALLLGDRMGWIKNGEIVATLLPWLLPYTVFICLTGFMAGVLQSIGRFAVPAYMPVVLNGMFIIGILVVCPAMGDDPVRQVTGLSWMVLGAGVLQLGLSAWALTRCGMRLRFTPRFKDPNVTRVLDLFLLLVVGAAVLPVNTLIDRLLALSLGKYVVNSLYFSERLVYLPVGVFAVALSVACLPSLSRAAAANRMDEMGDSLCYAMRQVLFLTLPCMVVFLAIGQSIVEVIYMRGKFDAASVAATTSALLFYAPGIPAFAAAKIVRAGFISRQDARTPLKVALWCMGLNLVLNLILMWPLQQRGLALATSISSFVMVIVLSVILLRELEISRERRWQVTEAVLRQLGAALCGAAIIYAVRPRELLVDTFERAGWLGFRLALFSIVYLGVLSLLKAREPKELWEVVHAKLSARKNQV